MSAQRRLVAVESCLQPVELPKHRVQARDYRTEGLYPVVDQGQSDVSGWTDSADGLICNCLPVIVFGDHTRAVKYLDQPFVRGADGTQILKPRDDIDPEYFFFALCSIELESRGYNRHLQQLKAAHIPLVDLSAQQTIGRVLRLVREAIALNDRALATAEELHAAVMAHVFTYGLRGEPTKETEIGPIPESWDMHPLGEILEIQSGTTPSRARADYWEGGEIPWVKSAEVAFATVTQTSEHLTRLALDDGAAKRFPAGTVLLAMYGQGGTRGRVALLGIDAACNQACAAIRTQDGQINPSYLLRFLTWRYEEIRTLAHGGQQQNLNLDLVRGIPIAVPADAEEQREIARLLDAVAAHIDTFRAKKVLLEELFQSLLQRFFGEDQDDIDFEALATMLGEGSVA